MSEDICVNSRDMHTIHENVAPDCGIVRELNGNGSDCAPMKIVEELNEIFQNRLDDIEKMAKNDVQLVSQTYKDWVDTLGMLIRDLIQTMKELENETYQRVSLIERKLEIECKLNHSNRKNRILHENDKKQDYDLSSLTSDGLNLHVDHLDNIKQKEESKDLVRTQVNPSAKDENCERCRFLQTLATNEQPSDEAKGDEEISSEVCDEVFKLGICEIREMLRTNNEALENALSENQRLQNEVEKLKKAAINHEKAIVNQRALAFEVADKHDQILQMRDEINVLEEEVKKAHKKIQLKDDVIRELRKECRIYPKNSIDDTGSSKPLVTFNPNQICSSPSMDSSIYDDEDLTIKTLNEIGLEHLRKGHQKEFKYITKLKAELEDLFKQHQNEKVTFDDQRRFSINQQRSLRQVVDRLVSDLQKSRAKLFYIQSKLLDIIGAHDAQQYRESESGYLSQEDLQSEDTTIERIRGCIKALRDENLKLKNEIKKLSNDIESVNSSLSVTSEKTNYNEKILNEIAAVVSRICGKDIVSDTSISNQIELHPLCKAMENLQNEFCEQQDAVQSLNKQLYRKDETITDLHKVIAEKESDVQESRHQQAALLVELNEQKLMIKDMETSISALKTDKTTLETECDYQQTTISNLRKALEDSKRHPGVISLNSVSSSNDTTSHSTNNNSSLWSWWRSNVHDPDTSLDFDVLCDLVADLFLENMRLEKANDLLRDDNVELKEKLVDCEVDYTHLEEDYLRVMEVLHRAYENDFVKQAPPPSVSRREGSFHDYAAVRDNMEVDECRRMNIQEIKYRDPNNHSNMESNDIPVMDFERSFREVEIQNEMLQKSMETLEANNRALTSSLKNNEIEIIKLKRENTTLQSEIKEKTAKYDEIFAQFKTVFEMLKVQKLRCTCQAADAILLDEKHIELYKTKSVDNIFDILERRTSELEAVKKYASEEKNRLTNANWELEEKIKQGEIKLSLLDKTLQKRDDELREANKKLLGYPDKEQEKHYKEIITKLTQDISSLTAAKREREQDLTSEVTQLHQSMLKTNETILNLERQINTYRKHGDFITKENAFLKADLFKMRETLAQQEGVEKGLRDQLQRTQVELAALQLDLERSNKLNEEMETIRRNCTRLKEANYDLVRKYNDLVEDYNSLQEEYRKLLDVKETLLREIDLTRQWQQEQTEHDKLIKIKVDQQAETINTLMEDRENLISKVNELYRDACIIGSELEQYKDAFEDSLK